jgi:hypothetical protein
MKSEPTPKRETTHNQTASSPLTYDERIRMAAEWLERHKGELIPCAYMSTGYIREKSCEERQARYPKWSRMRAGGSTCAWVTHPRFSICVKTGCPRFDPGEQPKDDDTAYRRSAQNARWVEWIDYSG